MKIFLISIGAIVSAIILFIVYRLIKVRVDWNRQLKNQERRVAGLIELIESKKKLSSEDVLPYANNVLSRKSCHELLLNHGLLELFPPEFKTRISAAESYLANWLEFPTEMGACPTEIQHLETIVLEIDEKGQRCQYEAFKFKMKEPHWAAKDGWMMGVVGPYFNDSKDYYMPNATFSRAIGIQETNAENEVRWVHNNIASRFQ